LGETEGHRLRRGHQHASRVIDADFGDEDWAPASAFTDEGLENLRYIIDETRLHGS
jgi:hypothetical protein